MPGALIFPPGPSGDTHRGLPCILHLTTGISRPSPEWQHLFGSIGANKFRAVPRKQHSSMYPSRVKQPAETTKMNRICGRVILPRSAMLTLCGLLSPIAGPLKHVSGHPGIQYPTACTCQRCSLRQGWQVPCQRIEAAELGALEGSEATQAVGSIRSNHGGVRRSGGYKDQQQQQQQVYAGVLALWTPHALLLGSVHLECPEYYPLPKWPLRRAIALATNIVEHPSF